MADAAPEVADAAREDADAAADEAADAAEEAAELIAEPAELIMLDMAEVAAEAAELAAPLGAMVWTEAGTETEIPAAEQTPARAEATLGISSAEQREGRHCSRELVMAPWPVVHWQVTSVTPQPEPGMAATRQATAQSGTCERSGVWAETTASEVANAAMVEKRILIC